MQHPNGFKPVVITVTQADINSGVQRSCSFCPVALAAKRKLRRKNIAVGSDTIFAGSIVKDKYRRQLLLPAEATAFILAFDRGQGGRAAMKPFTFTAQEVV